MAISASKATLVADMQGIINSLIPVKNSMQDMVKTWNENGFNVGGANQLVDADVAAYNLVATTVQNTITMFSQLANFFGNVAVTQGDYEASIQKMRTT